MREIFRLYLRLSWSTHLALVLTPGLLWVYGRRAIDLHGERSSLGAYLLVAAGLGFAAYYCYWIAFTLLPRFALELRLNRAYAKSDWSQVKAQLELAMARGWESDEWTATLAVANGNLGDIEAALACYERIHSPLPSAELEYARIFNHSFYLLQAGDIAGARRVFESIDFREWPEPMRQHVVDHRTRLEDAGGKPPATH